ncbi:hypothetical protein [Anabaena azotica]|uniref:Uncharacterized protein n=1 Tax=Anabaena azotica FACHB-119 TaxID=947527 RepID=A0ABR8D9M7_9NOST|nr:hypothetical protein [Anabaena azotica]MBD2503276.1 hypothetical protein [Anabaena azotica FACHB-119]
MFELNKNEKNLTSDRFVTEQSGQQNSRHRGIGKKIHIFWLSSIENFHHSRQNRYRFIVGGNEYALAPLNYFTEASQTRNTQPFYFWR